MAILPQSFRDIGEGTPPEFFFWAIGLFLITAPAVTRILGPRKIRGSGSGWPNVPASLLGYFVICLAASFQGLRLGAEPGYVLRQLYGIVLFIVYFAVAVIYVRSIDDIVILLRKMRVVAACVGVATLILVSADRSGEVGIFKRNISVYMAALACYSFGELLHAKTNRGRLSWGLQVSVFILHPIIFLSRGAVGMFVICALLGVGLKVCVRRMKLVMVLAALAILVAGVVFNLFAPVSRWLSKYEATERLVPEEVLQDPSAIGRINQVFAAVEAVGEHPLLGKGLGSRLTFVVPGLDSPQSEALIDAGYAYLASKCGLLGVGTFVWLLASVAARSGWPGQDGLHLGLFLMFVFHILCTLSAPIMFQFLFTPWTGVTCAFLYCYPTLQHRNGLLHAKFTGVNS
jgi:hypothetical protein